MTKNKWIRKRKIRDRFGDIYTSAEQSFWQSSELSERSLELEKEIAKSAHFSYVYAVDLEEQFPLGEIAISKNAEYSYMYAKNILKGRFEPGEEAIVKDKKIAFRYCSYLKEIGINPPFALKIANEEYLERLKFSFFNKDGYV